MAESGKGTNGGDRNIMSTKGALKNVLACCTTAETADGHIGPLAAVQDAIEKQFEEQSAKGYRTLAVAYKDNGDDPLIERDHNGRQPLDRHQCHAAAGHSGVTDPVRPGAA